MRKIIKGIPNTITSMNLFCGCIAITMAFKGNLEIATYFIFAAAILDFFDGFTARLLNAHSPIGLQLDSLADVVSFGVAPSVIIFHILTVTQTYIQADIPAFIPYVAFLLAVFSALRLAKFNVDERQTDSFIGLNTPACTLFICGLVYFNIFSVTGYYFLLALIPVLCFLLVCELPMFSLKIKKTDTSFLKKYGWQIILLVCSIVFIAVWHLKGITLAIGLYVILSVIKMLIKK